MSNDNITISLGGCQMTITATDMQQLHLMQQHATWVPGTINKIIDELIDIGSSCEKVNHRSIIGHLKDLKEIAEDYRFIDSVSIRQQDE